MLTNLSDIPADSAFKLQKEFKECTNESKVNLSIGYVMDDVTDQPLYLKSVAQAKREIYNDRAPYFYLPILGMAEFCKASQEILFGGGKNEESDILSVQTLGGTGAISLAIKLWYLNTKETKSDNSIQKKQNLDGNYDILGHSIPDYSIKIREEKQPKVYIPDPTWTNHVNICKTLNIPYSTFSYYDEISQTLDFHSMENTIEHAIPGSLIILQLCGNNPTGADLGLNEWFMLEKIISKRRLIVLFDNAYQGLISGDLGVDGEPVSWYRKKGVNIMVAQSFSKNFGLYCERIGALHIIGKGLTDNVTIKHTLENLIRTDYSNPPKGGAEVVVKVWNNPKLRKQWLNEIEERTRKIRENRQALFMEMHKLGYSNASIFLVQKGLFSLLDLSDEKIRILKDEGIFLLSNGRINFSGLDKKNVKHVARVLVDIIKQS